MTSETDHIGTLNAEEPAMELETPTRRDHDGEIAAPSSTESSSSAAAPARSPSCSSVHTAEEHDPTAPALPRRVSGSSTLQTIFDHIHRSTCLPSGHFLLQNRASGRVLDVRGANGVRGVEVRLRALPVFDKLRSARSRRGV